MNVTNHEPSIWETTSHATRAYAPLKGDIETDVCVVGAGITGLTTALLLKQAGRRVTLVEKDRIGAGTSGGTSAHLTSLVDFDYQQLIQSYGVENARRVARSLMSAIDLIEELQTGLGIDCAFKRIPGYYYTETPADVASVRDEFEGAERCGVPVRLLDKAPLPFSTASAFLVQDQAQFQPMDYLQGLARALEGGGCSLHEQTPVTDVSDGSPCELRTPQGVIRAQTVVLATHTPLGMNILQSKLNSYRSFVLAARVKDLPEEALFWDTAEPYHYIRTYRQGNQAMVIVGGKDHKVGHGNSDDSFRALEAYTRTHFEVETIEARWSAQFYDPTDHLPMIGKNPLGRHVYVATGFSGDGLTFGTLAGRMIADQIVTGSSDYEDLYNPSRVGLAGAGEFIKKNFHVTQQFVMDRVTTPTAKKIAQLQKEEGCVVRDGTSYLAAYRDVTGDLRTYSAICPHMKCVLHWNQGEKSWDCPCHGSRFDVAGNQVDGPATGGLEPIQWKETQRQPEDVT